MREIKFRAWSKIKKEMNYNPIFLYDRDGIRFTMEQESEYIWETRIYEDSFVWNQYTGLKDKNDVEIYEGDIVRTIENSGIWLSKVEYVVDCFCAGLHSISSYKDIEVIGNIYENPELIEVEL